MDTPADGGSTPATPGEARFIEELIAGTTSLHDAILGLTTSIGLLIQRDRVTRRLVYVAVVAVVAVLAVLGITIKVWTTTYVTQQQQSQTRTRVLCPLYSLLLASFDPAQAQALTPAQRSAYQVIHDGYTTLGCVGVPATAPPR